MKLIVSLTTTSLRVSGTHQVLESMLSQTLLPDEIHLCVSSEPFLQDRGIRTLPPAIERLARDFKQIQVRWIANSGPYRKLLPVLLENWGQDVVIVTVDDDAVYPDWILNRMMRRYEKHGCVVAGRGRRMSAAPYVEWPTLREEVSGPDVFPVGQSGILYHPSFFTERVFDPLSLELAPTADDIWFFLNTRLTGTPVRVLGKSFPALGYDDSLWNINKNRNDSILNAVTSYLGIRI